MTKLYQRDEIPDNDGLQVVDPEAYNFIFNDVGDILVDESGNIPSYEFIKGCCFAEVHHLTNSVVACCGINNRPKSLKFISLRTTDFSSELYQLVAHAKQLLYFYQRHRFCGVCGAATSKLSKEVAVKCNVCSEVFYPELSPAIIVAIIKDKEILLARSVRHKETFSLIAGFVEPSETLETCVHREVMEEVGLKVNNLRYLKSQPWPFPNSLMVGFICDYVEGEITPQLEEIEEAAWYNSSNLPKIPTKNTIAGVIIESIIDQGLIK